MSQVASLLRSVFHHTGGPLNILTFPTHERMDSMLARTGHNFYLYCDKKVKEWNYSYAALPENFCLLNSNGYWCELPTLDLVISQNKWSNYPLGYQIAAQNGIPLISLEHTLPPTNITQVAMQKNLQMVGTRGANVFISDFSRQRWGFSPSQSHVIHHGVDSEMFCPGDGPRQTILSVVNDWKRRDWCCGYTLWEQAIALLPDAVRKMVRVVGDTPGLSKAAKDTKALASEYRNATVFVNTSLVSPIPTSLLEAMSSGCAVVTTGNCMIPDVVKHQENGLIADTPQEIATSIEAMVKNPHAARHLGDAARQTICDQFSLNVFVQRWDKLIRDVVRRGLYANY